VMGVKIRELADDAVTLKEILKSTLSDTADRMMDGDTVGKPSNNPLMPPVDTGESIGLGASKLTITFGISKSLMKKIGLSSKIPDAFKDLPHFPNDQLIDDYSDGDLMIQACSNDSQVSFHAVHNLVRPFRDIVKVRWAQSGF
ncbi:Dyp-type peroxidase domain-containing protein, partial [Staphylococcus aureus]|uniref:Dyp-type peroxidase domain-containing protein n=1 Tax=Staphylococcus aureus TaxID=1280 RepID=UPI00210B1A85